MIFWICFWFDVSGMSLVSNFESASDLNLIVWGFHVALN